MNPWMKSVEQSLAGGIASGASQPSGTLSHYASLVEKQKAAEFATSPIDQAQLISQLRATIAQQQATANLQLQTTTQTQQRLVSLQERLAAAENAHETCRRTLAETQQKLDDYNAADGFIVGDISLNELEKADLDAKLAAAQAKCTALNEEVERLRRMSEAAATDACKAEEAHATKIAELREAVQTGQKRLSAVQIELDGWMHSFETVEFERVGANEMLENARRIYAGLCEDYMLTCNDEANADENATKRSKDALDRTAELNEARGKLAQQEAQMAEHRKGFIQSTTAMHEQLTDQKTRNGELSGEVDALRAILEALKKQRALFIQALSGLGLGHVKEAVLDGDISKVVAATLQDGAAAGEAMEIDRDAGASALVRLGEHPSGAEEDCRACKEPSRREKHTCGRQRKAPAPVGERPYKAAKTSANPKVERATMPSASKVKLYLDGLLVMFGAVDADPQDKLDELRRDGHLPAKSRPGEPSTLTLGHFDKLLKLDGHDDRLQQPDSTFMTPRAMLLAHVKQSFDQVQVTNANAVYQELFRWLTNEKFNGTRRHELPQWHLHLDKTRLQIVLAIDPTRHAEMIRDMSDDDE